MRVEETILSLKTGFNPRQDFKLNVGGACPYITGKDLRNFAIEITERTDHITQDVVDLINRRVNLATNDVLFSCVGIVGRMAVVENYDHSWAISGNVLCLKPNLHLINPYYLMFALSTASAQAQLRKKVSTGSYSYLKSREILDVTIPVPSLKEQEQIVRFKQRLDSLYGDLTDCLSAEIEARKKQYQYYRDSLLSFKEAH